MKSFLKSYHITVILVFLLSSCKTTKENGSMFIHNIEKVKNFDSYNFSKEDVIRNFGEPTFELEDGTWLYYNYKTKNLNFLREKINEEHILFVKFDKNDKVTNYSYKHRDNLKSVISTKIDNEIENEGNFKDAFKGINIKL